MKLLQIHSHRTQPFALSHTSVRHGSQIGSVFLYISWHFLTCSFHFLLICSPNWKLIWRYSCVYIDVLMFCCQRRLENWHSNTSFPRIVGRILRNNTTLHGFSSTGRSAAQVFVNCNGRSIPALPLLSSSILIYPVLSRSIPKWGRHPRSEPSSTRQ